MCPSLQGTESEIQLSSAETEKEMAAETPLENQGFSELQVQTLQHCWDGTALAILWAKSLILQSA